MATSKKAVLPKGVKIQSLAMYLAWKQYNFIKNAGTLQKWEASVLKERLSGYFSICLKKSYKEIKRMNQYEILELANVVAKHKADKMQSKKAEKSGSILLLGNTYQVKELIKKEGGVFNPAEKGWNVTTEAWEVLEEKIAHALRKTSFKVRAVKI